MGRFRLKISQTLYENSPRLRWLPSTYYVDITQTLEVQSEQEPGGRCGGMGGGFANVLRIVMEL